jgi:RNA polymerase sigma factor (sigma-70 family)
MSPPAEGLASRLFLGPALRTQPDRRLVTLVREGYEVAFEEIVRRYGRPLGRYAASIVGGRSEDVLQDAFAKALPALQRDEAEIDLKPWLFRIVRNTALNELRDSPPSAELLAEMVAGGRNPAEELECREELADLMRRLRALPEPQRAAIVMRELEGLGHEEIAAALGLTGGGARQAIYRARQALRDGAGLLLPLPLVRTMLEGAGSGTAEVAAGTVRIGGAAGAGVALKATAATVMVAGAVGAGVALKENSRSQEAKAAPARISDRGPDAGSSPDFAVREVSGGSVQRRGRGDSGSRGRPEASENRDGQSADSGRNDGGDSSGSGSHEKGEPGGGGSPRPSRSNSSGEGSGVSRSGSDDSNHSGLDQSGSDVSEHSGSDGDSGSGEDGSGHDESSSGSEDSHSGSGAESVSSGDSSGDSGTSSGSGDSSGSDGGGERESGSGDSGETLRDLPDGSGLTD